MKATLAEAPCKLATHRLNCAMTHASSQFSCKDVKQVSLNWYLNLRGPFSSYSQLLPVNSA